MRTLLLLLLLLAPAQAAYAIGAAWPLSDNPRFWILGEGFGHLSLDGYYFRTRENYDDYGYAVKPVNQDVLHYTNVRVHGGFGFAPRLSLFAQAEGRGLFMDTNVNLPARIAYGENYGFGDAFLAFRWLAYRSRSTDRLYPTEWAPETFMTVVEGSWNFPMYDSAAAAKPPLGDQSNDLTALIRLAWYTNDWLALSGSGGYTHRTAGYSAGVPWSVRGDISLLERSSVRFWAELSSFQSLARDVSGLNPRQPDPFPSGSYLFKTSAPILRTATLGAAHLISKEWELSGAFFTTATGADSAKGFGGGLGLAWRPYQVPEIKYEEYRVRQLERLSKERFQRHRKVQRLGFRATILKVSQQGNFLKIAYGQNDKLREGDTFYVMPPDDFEAGGQRPLAFATVARVQPEAAYLRVDERYMDELEIEPGYEVRRVYFEED